MPGTPGSTKEDLAYLSERFPDKYPAEVAVYGRLATKGPDIAVFSVGCGNNPPERAPLFAKVLALAEEGQRVEVFNFDHPLSEDTPEHIEALRKRVEEMPPNLKISLLENKYFFPKDEDQTPRFKEYIKAILARKKKNPDFKFVFISSLGPIFSDYMFRVANELVSNGFKLGHDFELIHAYHIGDPALIYRDMGFLETLNRYSYAKKDAFAREFSDYICMGGGHKFDKPHYDKERHVFCFPNLDQVTDLFEALTPESIHKSKPKLKS